MASRSFSPQFGGRRSGHLSPRHRKTCEPKISHFLVRFNKSGEIYVKHGFRTKQILCRFSFRKYETRTSPKSENGYIPKPSASGVSQRLTNKNDSGGKEKISYHPLGF